MKLAGAVSEGSGPVNEDGWGKIGPDGDVSAIWVFDGVTGINGFNLLGGSDAAWLVDRADRQLRELAAHDLPLAEILRRLVAALCEDWAKVPDVPADFDPPAACLILAKRYADGWKALRLGDSCLLARGHDGKLTVKAPENEFDNWLAAAARKRRVAGQSDIKALLREFRPQLLEGRAKRNRPGGYGILEADPKAALHAEYFDLGLPSQLLICTDGFYRAVDHYAQYTNEELLKACAGRGVQDVLTWIRAIEAADPDCARYPRFKSADDATAVMLQAS